MVFYISLPTKLANKQSMKKLMFLFVAAGALMLASCETAGKKSEGTYTGNHTAPFVGTQSGTVIAASTGDQAVNMTLSCPSFSINSTATGVTATISGNNVAFTFTGTGTADGTITALSGNLTDKTLTLAYTIIVSGNGASCSFTGTKP